MSQELLVRCTAAEALVAARLLEGGDAEGAAAALLLEASVAGGNAAILRRARWLHALARILAPTDSHLADADSDGPSLRAELEGVRDEPPCDGTALDWARHQARKVLEAEEALDEARAAAVLGEEERCEAALSMAFVGLDEFGPGEEARRCVRAFDILMLRREESRAESLLRVARDRFAEAGDVRAELAVALIQGDRASERSDLRAAWTAFDEARALARMHELVPLELAMLRRLLPLAAKRRDPRSVRQLVGEITARLELLPASAAELKAATHWVVACVLMRTGDRMQAMASYTQTLQCAEVARSMPLAWLAAAQLGEPLPSELVRRLQKPPIEVADLLDAARTAAEQHGDPDLRRGYLEAALRVMSAYNDRFDVEHKECEAALAALPDLNI